MAFADTSDTQLAIIEETVFGAIPATPVWQLLRFTGENLQFQINSATSNEIRPDAEVADLIQIGASVTGSINFEVSFGAEFDTLLQHALRGTFDGVTNIMNAATEKRSLAIEKRFMAGANPLFIRYVGCRIGGLSLSVQQTQDGQILTGSFDVTGTVGSTDTAIVTGATYTDPNSNDVMSTTDVASITVGGGASANLFFTDLSLTLTNNLRAQGAVGNLGAVGIGYGRREVTGSVNHYVEDVSIYNDFIAGTPAALAFTLTDGTNSYVINMPRIKYNGGNIEAGGNNQDVIATMTHQALFDSGTGTSIQITKS